jgi:hypothetical protein
MDKSISNCRNKRSMGLYAKGSNLDYDASFESDNVWKTLHRDDRTTELAEALKNNQSDVIVAALGESAK